MNKDTRNCRKYENTGKMNFKARERLANTMAKK